MPNEDRVDCDTMTQFEIHSRLLLDAFRLGRFSFCHVLLHKNAVVPWFILVPETQAVDLLDLPDGLRATALDEAGRVSSFIKQDLGYPRINFAAIGNVVPQLHLHVVGRKPGDSCWPAPVWGNLLASREYSDADVRQFTDSLVDHAGLTAAVP
jgi:diadenosine tetraphosphate (Ap4A) HIT family hydrolase